MKLRSESLSQGDLVIVARNCCVSYDPVVALLEFTPNFYDLLLEIELRNGA
jgi:hypothetical protein